jgi:LemA protein
VSRTDYNAAAQAYNSFIRTLPQKFTAMVTGAKPLAYYQAPPGAEVAPTVDFSKPATPPK